MVHPNALAFREGVTLLFKKWDALKLAVQMEWGGVESKEKRDWMIDVVVEYFGKNGKKTEVEDIEDILNQIMSDEFETVLEDDSSYIVAKQCIQLYNEVITGNHETVIKLREQVANQASQSNIVAGGNNDEEDDDDDEEYDSDEMQE